MTKRERMLTGIIALLVAIIIIGMAFLVTELKGCGKTSITADEIDNYEYSNIGMSEYKSLINDTNTHIIYVARPTCGYCEKEDPILKEVAVENDLEVNYLNIDELTTDELKELMTTDESLEELSTPTFLIVKNKSIVASNVGYLDKSELESFFQKYEIIE